MMRILVLGATGMLGHRLLLGLDKLGYEVMAGVRRDVSDDEPFRRWPVLADRNRLVTGLDAYQLDAFRHILTKIRPDVIVNCIGLIKQIDASRSSVSSITLNALLPHALEEMVADWNGWLIHFSTDCVFRGDRGGYTEHDECDATDWYGRTKAMGEVVGDHALTLRTSIIGRELRQHCSLLDWFLAQNGRTVRGFARAIYSGLTTREMVNVIDLLLRQNFGLNGLFQVASEPVDKYSLLHRIREALSLRIEIERDETVQIDRSLDATRFFYTTGYQAPSWDQMIEGLAEDVDMYEHTLNLAAAQE